MAQLVTRGRVAALPVLWTLGSLRAAAQQRDTTAPARPQDSLKVYTLPPAVVSVTRANPPINRIPQAVQLLEKTEISRARPTWGLDEALATVPGVYAANRYNFSLDQRISIRGFGARSAFAVRGIKVLVDGIPQTLPDGQGQLTNLELGAADRIEILRGSASALFGNASGGVISIWTDPTAPRNLRQEVRVLFGTFDRNLNRNWSKWKSSTSFRVGAGSGLVTVSRLDYTGQRQHSDADFRNLNSRWHFPLANGWSPAAARTPGPSAHGRHRFPAPARRPSQLRQQRRPARHGALARPVGARDRGRPVRAERPANHAAGLGHGRAALRLGHLPGGRSPHHADQS